MNTYLLYCPKGCGRIYFNKESLSDFSLVFENKIGRIVTMSEWAAVARGLSERSQYGN